MSVEAIKLSIITYFGHLGLYDYLALVWLIVTFFIIIVLAVMVAKRSSALSLLLIVFALFFLAAAPFVIKSKISQTIRTNTATVTTLKRLTFTPTIVIEASVQNRSNNSFSLCLLNATVNKKTNEENIKNFINKLKPLANQSIVIKRNLLKGETMEHQFVFDDFKYNGEVDATIKAECY